MYCLEANSCFSLSVTNLPQTKTENKTMNESQHGWIASIKARSISLQNTVMHNIKRREEKLFFEGFQIAYDTQCDDADCHGSLVRVPCRLTTRTYRDTVKGAVLSSSCPLFFFFYKQTRALMCLGISILTENMNYLFYYTDI